MLKVILNFVIGLILASFLLLTNVMAVGEQFINLAKVELLTKNPQQGSMLIAKISDDVDVFFENKKLNKTSDNLIVFGVGRESKTPVYLTIKKNDKEQKIPIAIKSRSWKIEKIDGLPPSKVNPTSAKVLAQIKQDVLQVKNARNTNSKHDYFIQTFVLPAKGRISGVYGSQRILNGEPKNPHYGLDIANKIGTVVYAPIDGKVIMAANDMYYSGATLIIDHGFGINSTYMHLNSIDVTLGQSVKQGQPIATIGASGRATGPHLDWRLNWFQTRLDPALMINDKNFNNN